MPRKKPKKRKNVVTSPAREARLQAQQKWPGATVIDRNRSAIYHRHPTLPRVMIDAIIGAMHTLDGREIDTAWKSSTSPWNHEVTLSDYITRIKTLFNTADIIQWEKGGQTISFIARQLEWTNDRNDVQLIGNPQAVPVFIDNDRAIWADAFGSGLDFTWINKTDRLAKLLTIESLSSLGTPSSQILTGGNPVLRLQFQFNTSNSVDIYVNGVRWNRTGQSETTGSVEFRHANTGESLWYFDPGKVWDTATPEHDVVQISPVTRFRRTGPNVFVEVRVPYTYLQTALFPVYVDPTIDVSIGASADDANEASNGNTTITDTVNNPDGANEWAGLRFTGITITNYSSMVTGSMALYFPTSTLDEPQVTIYGEDTATPAQYSVGNNIISGRTRTTASVAWDNANLGAPGTFNTPSLNTIIDELATSYTYNNGVMAFDITSTSGDTSRDCSIALWDNATDPAPALHIEYNQTSGETKSISDTGTGNDLFEYPRTLPSGSFPNLARLLDDFNRESLGSKWTTIVGQPAIVGNKFVGLTSGTVGLTGNEAEWNAGLFGSPVAWYVTIGNLQPSGTIGNDVSILYDQISSTSRIRMNINQIYDTLIDRISFFAFSPIETIYDTGVGVNSAFTYSQRSNIRIGAIHQNNGYATVYLDRGNGWEAVGGGFYSGSHFVTGTVRLKLEGYSEDGSDTLVPTVTLDDFYLSTLDSSWIFVSGTVQGTGQGIDSPSSAASLGMSDLALGGDFLDLSASIPVSDFGFGTDTITIIQAVLKLITDVGNAVDAVSIQSSLSLTETASGQEVILLQASLMLSDTSSGIDSPEVGALLNISDTVLGGDFINLSAAIPVSESGLGAESVTLSAVLVLSDTGSGLDDVTVTQLGQIIKTILDTASGLDAVSIQVSLSTTETATGQDAILLQATLGLSDSAVGVDSPEVGASVGISDNALGGDFFDLLASLSVSESGTSSDLLQLLASLSVSDTGSGADAVSVLAGVIKSIADSGLGSDEVSISVSLSLSDTGTGVDALTISVSITVLDTGTGVDEVTVSKVEILLKTITDIASGSDSLSISASLNIGETSYGIDDPAIQAALGLVDSGEGLESPQISAELSITDTSSATDFLSILQTVLKSIIDAGTGTDAITQISASIPVSEIGIGADQVGQILSTLLVTDFGEGVDTVVKFDSTTNILRITFELRKPKIVATLSQPTISIELAKPMVKFSLNV